MKKLTFMFAMLLMAVVSFAQDVVTPPAQIFTEDYLFEGTLVTSGVQRTPAQVTVAFDGNDVYMQGLAYGYPEGWAKGTLNGNVVTFAKNQYMGGTVYFCPDYDVVFTYNADEPSFTSEKYEVQTGTYSWEMYRDIRLYQQQPLTEDQLIEQMTISPENGSTQTSLKTFTLTFPEVVTIDETVLPTLNDTDGTIALDETGKVVTLEFEEMTEPGVYTLLIPFGAIMYNELPIMAELKYEFNVLPEPELSWTINPAEGKVESLKNFTLTFKDGSVTFNTMGYTEPTLTKDGENVFEPGRIYAKSSSAVQVFDINFGSLSNEDDAITADGTYVLTIHAADFTNKKTGEAIAEEDLVYTFTIGEGGDQPGDEPGVEPGDDELVTPPATAEQKDYLFEANNKYYTSTTYNRAAKVAVDGNDVYFQGLSSQMPEAWVKGTMADGNVTVAGKQLLGTYVEDNTAYGGEKKEFDLYFSPEGENVVFAYNAEEDAYTTAAYGIDVTTDAMGKNEDYINVKIYTEPFDVMDYVAINPEEGEVETIGAFTVTFGDYEVATTSPTAVASLKNNTTEEELFAPILVVANKKVMLSYEETTTPGEYTLNIPAGSLKVTVDEKEVEVPELNFNYTIAEPVVFSWTIDPEEGQVEGLTNVFNIQFENGNVTYDYTQADPTLTKDGESLAEFASMNISNSQKATLYFGSVSQTIDYTEDGTYVLTIPAGTLKNNGEAMEELTFTWTIGQGGEQPGEDVLVEVPAGVEQEDWHIEAVYYTSQGGNDINVNNKVAFDGEDVYIQGLAYYFPEAWVKGKMINGQAVFASGQFVGEDEYGKEYLNGASIDESYNFIYEDSYVFNYDAEAQKFTLAEGYLTECETKDAISAWGYYSTLEIIKGEAVQPEVVVAPENLETEDYIFKAQEMSFDDNNEPVYEDYEAEIKIGFDGNDVYVQGICAEYYLPEAWVKGEKNGNTVTFATGQFFGTVYNQYDMYFVGYGESGIEDVVMTYDEATGEFTTDNWIFINGKQNDLYYYTIYTSNVFTKNNQGDVSAIENVNAEDSNAVYFDAMGRRTNGEAKGLVIKQVRTADGVKAVKMVRK